MKEGEAHLAIVDRKVQVVQGMMRGSVDDRLEWVSGDHVGVVNLRR
jgi:hypothetical protein